MVSMPSFSWRSSPTGPAGTAAAAAAAVAVAYGSAAATSAAVPSAPPASSSEEASVARSNSTFSRSASCSLSSSEAAATAATAAAIGAGGDGIVSSGAVDGDFGPPTFPSSGAASLTAEEDVVCGVGNSSTPFGNGSGSTAQAVGGNLALHNLGELATGRGHDSARTGGEPSGSVSSYRLSIEEADEEVEKAGGTMKASSENQNSERRMSPPWDDSMLGLRGLTPDELVARVLQAEKESRHWQAQHALVDRKLTDLLTAMTKHSRRPGGDGDCNVHSGGSLNGETACVPPEDATTTGQGSSALAAGSCPEQPSCFSPHRGGRATETTEETPWLVTPADVGDAGTSLETNGALNRGCDGADEAREKTARGMIDEWNGDGMPISPRKATIDGARGKKPMLHNRGGGIAVVDHASTNKRSPRSTPVGVAAADSGDSNNRNNDTKDSGNSSPPQQMTFKERRAVFSSNNSVPALPGAVALPWSVAVGKVDTCNTPSLPQSSMQRTGSCTPPTIAAFSPAAVEAARQNLKRSKTSAKRVSALVGVAATGTSPRRGRGPPCRLSGSRSSAASVTPVLLSSSAASSPSTAPFTPPRSRHHRGTAAAAPSPPAPSPCSTADRFRTTPGSPARLSSASSTSSWVPSPQSSWAPFSPQLESPPSFPKPITEMGRRARAVAPDDGGKLDDEEFGDSDVLLSVRSGFWQGWPGGRCQRATGTPRESSVSFLPSKVDLPGGGRPGVRSDVGIGSGTDQPRHQQQQQQQQQQRRGCGTARPATGGDGAGGDVSFSPGAGASSSLSGTSRSWSPAVKFSPSGPPSLSPTHAKAVSASSSSMASVILETAGAAPAAPASRLPPTAPTLASRATASHPAALQPALAATEHSGSAAASTPFWSGTALRQKSVRLQQPSVSKCHVPAAAISDPNLVPENDRIEGASLAAGTRDVEGRDGVKVCYGSFGGGGGGGGGTSTRQKLPDSKRSLASPQDDVAASFRGGGGGGGGSVEDAWKERPPGVGPWPLFERTREGRASLDDKLHVSNRGSAGSGGGTRKIERLTAPETKGEPTARVVIPSVAAEADPEVSIGNIGTMQASRLRALREKMERRYSWARGTTIPATKAAATSLAVNIAASPPIPEGSHSSFHMSAAYSRQSQEGMVEKPWGTATSRTGVVEAHAHNNGSGPPPNQSSEGFKLMVPGGWDPPK
ncbi:unnamed protein product [Ectocarpus sp. CCAP 1310/34]|nr:unnamed protein product [Ectocarpus sp. CCAP 1310/34]